MCLLLLLPQAPAQSFAVQVPDHKHLLPLALLPRFLYTPISVYQMRNYSLLCSLLSVCVPPEQLLLLQTLLSKLNFLVDFGFNARRYFPELCKVLICFPGHLSERSR